MNETAHLNLARKWRSRRFDQVIGQDISVRMLQNTLYLEHFFPVYLFSGQRGCGKTTMARVFAGAINCEKFQLFKKQPKQLVIPCLACASCEAMAAGKHPDFIEIDAASHTGVDNVRNIIDAASLMPLMGRKKIYLIDEAHMLSKAAFNAFLKVLEEPPASVLFILATTDAHKIIETVRSRCFQLFFKPVDSRILLEHLKDICLKEGIICEDEGLALIIKQAEGSVRDALNMLETVRFSSSRVDKNTVLKVLGYAEDELVIALVEAVFAQEKAKILTIIQTIIQNTYTAPIVWQRFLEMLRACIWIKHGVRPEKFNEYELRLKKIAQSISWLSMYNCLEYCYRNESVFLKTSNQYAFFEMVLLQLCLICGSNNDFGPGFSSAQIVSPPQGSLDVDQEIDEEEEEESFDTKDVVLDFNQTWALCVQALAAMDDPLVTSIFKQGNFHSYDQAAYTLKVVFSKRLVFFQDMLDSTKHVWLPIVHKYFGERVLFVPQFTGDDQEAVKKSDQQSSVKLTTHSSGYSASKPTHAAMKYKQQSRPFVTSRSTMKCSMDDDPLLDIKQKEEWTKTYLLLHYFSGTVHEVRESIS